MSVESRCPSCAMGNHDRHDRAFGLTPGLIGGTYCGCTGDCATEFAEEGERLRAQWLDPAPPTGDSDREVAGAFCSECLSLMVEDNGAGHLCPVCDVHPLADCGGAFPCSGFDGKPCVLNTPLGAAPIIDPYCPDHGDRPTTYTECSCEGRARLNAARRPATGDTLTGSEAQQLGDDCLGGASPSPLLRRAVERILADRRTGEFNRAFPTVCPDCPHPADAHGDECTDADCGCDRSRDEFAVSVPRTGEADRIREAANLAINSVYGTDDKHAYMALRIAQNVVEGTPLPWKYDPPPTGEADLRAVITALADEWDLVGYSHADDLRAALATQE